MERIKENDMVVVITGGEKGKKGRVIEILPKKHKVMVQGVSLVFKHYKARKQGETSGIKKQERFISLSNVMPICPSCKQPVRVGAMTRDSGKKMRVCQKCKEAF